MIHHFCSLCFLLLLISCTFLNRQRKCLSHYKRRKKVIFLVFTNCQNRRLEKVNCRIFEYKKEKLADLTRSNYQITYSTVLNWMSKNILLIIKNYVGDLTFWKTVKLILAQKLSVKTKKIHFTYNGFYLMKKIYHNIKKCLL